MAKYYYLVSVAKSTAKQAPEVKSGDKTTLNAVFRNMNHGRDAHATFPQQELSILDEGVRKFTLDEKMKCFALNLIVAAVIILLAHIVHVIQEIRYRDQTG